MPIYDNSYTNSYIRITGCIVTYNLSKVNKTEKDKDEVYNVRDCYTNKKYIYWNAKNPNVLEFSNKILEKGLGTGRYLIVINDNGTHTEYINNNSPEFTVSFDGDSMNIVEKKVWGLYEQVDEHTDKFANIVSDIDGIRQDVGKVETTANAIKETVSRFDQKADAIVASVGSKTKTLLNDELRKDVFNYIIKLATELGLLLSNILVYIADLELNDEEKSKIRDSIEVLNTKKLDVDAGVEKVKNTTSTGKVKNTLISAQNSFNESHINLVNMVNRVLDIVGKIEENELTSLLTLFTTYDESINGLRSAIDDARMQTLGGSIDESMAQIKLETERISSEVSKKVDGKEFGSLIEQNYDSVGYAFKTAGGRSNGEYRVEITNEGLTVRNGYIKTNTLIPDNDCRIVLDRRADPKSGYYEPNLNRNDCRSIDVSTTGEDSIRLKHNSGTYVSVAQSRIRFYVGGTSNVTINSSGIEGVAKYTHDWGSYYLFGDYKSSAGLYCQYPGNGIRIKCYPSDSYAAIAITESDAWFNKGSDLRLKENIHYIDNKSENILAIGTLMMRNYNEEIQIEKDDIINYNENTYGNKDITRKDLFDFVKNDMKLCEYNYKGSKDLNLNFIAQDLKDNKLSDYFIDKSNDVLMFKFNHNYVSIIIGALQEEIEKREDLEMKFNELCNEIYQLKGE